MNAFFATLNNYNCTEAYNLKIALDYILSTMYVELAVSSLKETGITIQNCYYLRRTGGKVMAGVTAIYLSKLIYSGYRDYAQLSI